MNLCSRVLNGKYGRKKDLKREWKVMSSDSELWRSLADVAPKVCQNVAWEVGNGENVKFWYDSWLEGGKRLVDMCNGQLREDEGCLRVKDMYCAEEEDAWKSIGLWLSGMAPSEIESTLFTHVLFGFLNADHSTFEIHKSRKYLDSFSNTVKHGNPSIKTIISIRAGPALRLMKGNASSRKTFINSSFNVATTHGFDGIDFYWPYNNMTQSDMNTMAKFIQESRQTANQINEEYIITANVPCSPYYNSSTSIVYPVESMKANLNWIHVRTFGYTSPSNSPNFTAASSPLYDPSNENVNTDYFIRQWIDCGFPASKLVMGLPLFGYTWNLTDPKDDDIGAPATGEEDSLHNRIRTYFELKVKMHSLGGNSKYNATYVANYWSPGSPWTTFDGVEAIREKVSYAKNNKLLGYILWNISGDFNWELSLAAKGELEKPDKLVIFLITVAVFVLLYGATIFILCRRKFKVKAGKVYDNIPDLQVFSFSDIEEATDRFSNENMIGGGGFGLVYKGTLPNGERIAVKKRSKGSKQGFEEFKNEITLAARLQHVNLVQLLGYCTDKEEQMLVYEYMPNKSLDSYLFDPEKQHLLDWRQRVCIIQGVTHGLHYLQEYSRLTIIHRDLKPSNILLDHEMKPKIADFGMAKPFKKDVHESTNGFVRTYGYIPPECVKNGLYSVKSDVYSFGVLLLQIISGKRISGAYGENNDLNLMEYAYKLWKEGKGMEFVEASLDDTSSHCKLMRCLQVALLCVQNNAQDRPLMAHVSAMLRFEGNNIEAPKQPAYSKLENEREKIVFVQRSEICSQNETTMSPVLGR
ncbi:hypothetical protein K1719_003320 [Acacia pycnantha]|nr:hypothetical protein K1719_003320 [Acacia pycnantha]